MTAYRTRTFPFPAFANRAKGLLIGILASLVLAALAAGPARAAYADDGTLQAGAIVVGQEPAPAASAAGQASADRATVEKPHADGWERDGKTWRYWRGGKLVRGRWIVTEDAPDVPNALSGKQRYWIARDGALARKRLINPDKANDKGAGRFAYAAKTGQVVTGKVVVGNRIYLAKRNGELESGDDKGFFSTRKYDESAHRYYIDPDEHAVITGEVVRVPGFGKTYSFPKTGYLARGVQRIDSKHVLVADADGRLFQREGFFTTSRATGTRQIFYFEPTIKDPDVSGARTGLFKADDGKKYYAAADGSLFRNGYKRLRGTFYQADRKGALSRNAVIDRMARRAQQYSSPSRYLIMVDTDDTKFIVFTGSKGNWTIKYVWDCSTGAPETPTVLGVYHVGIKGYSFGHGYTCYYYTQFYGDYLIHTRIYQEGTHILQDSSMNTQVSQGCVRLLDENAYWVWKNVPAGTTVVTIV